MDRTLEQLSPLEQELARKFARVVKDRFGERAARIQLFGSRSRGQARPDSDMDILVLLRGACLADRATISDIATDLMLEHLMGFELAPRVMTPEHFQRLIDLERLFPQEVARDAIDL